MPVNIMKQILPKITIVTPSFNQGQFIEQTITSVLEQSYPNLEYIIIDGGSTDKTIEIIKKYEKWITYWISEKDNGQSHAINKGFSRSTGDVINWLNSDDYYEAGVLKHIGDIFLDPNVLAYSGISRIFSHERHRFSNGTDIYSDNLSKTIGWARIDQPETFFRKSAIDSIGFLNEDLHFVMDKDLWIRFLSQFGLNRVVKDERLIAHFRLHNTSKTVSLQEQFKKESHNLYYSYALQLGMYAYAKKIKSIFNVDVLSLAYNVNSRDKEMWETIFEYFLLYEGLEQYALNDYNNSKVLLNSIDLTKLMIEDVSQINNVKTRMRFIPVKIKMLLNRLS